MSDADVAEGSGSEDEVARARLVASQIASTKRQQKDKNGRSLENMMEELDMDAYDEEEVEERLFGVGTYYDNPEDDPNIEGGDDESEMDEMELRATDLVFLAARNEDEVGHLEVYVYEAADNVQGGNLFVHHDIMLPAFPLCVGWMGFNPKEPDAPGSLAAVGSMAPGIEVWDLDVVDAVDPVVVLGGVDEERSAEEKKKRKKKGKKATLVFQPGSHEDAVMSLSWNSHVRNVLVSGSADATVKVWDLAKCECAQTLTHHVSKVQSVLWNPAEANVLATGGFDHRAYVLDMRDPEHNQLRWEVTADVETIAWHPEQPTVFLVSSEDGMVCAFDARLGAGSKPMYRLQAHDKATTALSFCPAIPGLLATASTDKRVKLWDVSSAAPGLLATEDVHTGAVFAMQFCPANPLLLAAGGAKGLASVWDIRESATVARRFPKEMSALVREHGGSAAGEGAAEDN